YLWRERRLPSNVTVDKSKVKDELERERLSRIFEQGLESPAGSVLPIMREYNGRGRWRSGPWFLRSEKCYLIPGDSPLGYRLPLDSIAWVDKDEYPQIYTRDPAAELPPLRTHQVIRHQLNETLRGPKSKSDEAASAPPSKQQS